METESSDPLLPIRVVGDVPTVESLTVADGLGIRHKNLLETIRTHQQAIESNFGVIAFETRKSSDPQGSGRPRLIAHLTEDQALFIGTLSRNSVRVVEFKAILVKSFAEVRHRLAEAAPTLADQALIQMANLMADTQGTLAQLRLDMDKIMAGKKPSPIRSNLGRPSNQLDIPGLPRATSPIRQLTIQRIDEYCDRCGHDRRDTWNYLYRRMFFLHSVDVYRLKRIGDESLLDAIERYGRLNDLYILAINELDISDE